MIMQVRKANAFSLAGQHADSAKAKRSNLPSMARTPGGLFLAASASAGKNTLGRRNIEPKCAPRETPGGADKWWIFSRLPLADPRFRCSGMASVPKTYVRDIRRRRRSVATSRWMNVVSRARILPGQCYASEGSAGAPSCISMKPSVACQPWFFVASAGLQQMKVFSEPFADSHSPGSS